MALLRKKIIPLSIVLFCSLIVLWPHIAGAIDPKTPTFIDGLYDVATKTGYKQPGDTVNIARPEIIVGRIINIILGFIGVIILALIIYAGVLWTTARGNEQTVQKAKDIMLGGIIGLIIVFTAAGVANFVITQIGQALNR